MNCLHVSCDRRHLGKGLALLAFGILMPLLITENSLGIYRSLYRFMREEDFSDLLGAVVKLLCMNCLRTTPHYLGAFMISESIDIHVGGRRMILLKSLLSLLVLRVSYIFVAWITGINYDLGMPAIMSIICMTLLLKFHLFSVNAWNRSVMIAMIIVDMQCLTVVPPLSVFGFGRGEVATDIKNLANLLGFGNALLSLSLLLTGVFVFNTLITIKLVNDEHQLKLALERQQEAEKQLSDTRYNALMLRTFHETQNLVHDLKTPLTTIQGLSSLSEMLSESEQIQQYQQKISRSVDSINDMISEILHENQKTAIDVGSLIRMVSTFLSVNEDLCHLIYYEIRCPQVKILANKIRLGRALINIIENAATAARKAHGTDGRVDVVIDHAGAEVSFTVTDNGFGIQSDLLNQVWTPGFSLNQSTGLGLAFIKSVVENHGGRITMETEVMQFTRMTLYMKEVAE